MPLTKRDIAQIRGNLGLTQAQFAQLLGVHPITVSRWEHGALAPNTHQTNLIASFRKAVQQDEDVGDKIAQALVGAGVALALYYLLKAAFPKK